MRGPSSREEAIMAQQQGMRNTAQIRIEPDECFEDWCRVTAPEESELVQWDFVLEVPTTPAFREKWGDRMPGFKAHYTSEQREQKLSFAQRLLKEDTLMSTVKNEHWTSADEAYAKATGRTKEQILGARKLWDETQGVISTAHLASLNEKNAPKRFTR
jgi:hypothetical protein